MKITEEEVIHVADLARLDLTQAAIATFVEQIGQILEYVDSLQQVDTRGVAATSHAISLTNAFREDDTAEPLDRELSLDNAPEAEDGSFIVPKVIT